MPTNFLAHLWQLWDGQDGRSSVVHRRLRPRTPGTCVWRTSWSVSQGDNITADVWFPGRGVSTIPRWVERVSLVTRFREYAPSVLGPFSQKDATWSLPWRNVCRLQELYAHLDKISLNSTATTLLGPRGVTENSVGSVDDYLRSLSGDGWIFPRCRGRWQTGSWWPVGWKLNCHRSKACHSIRGWVHRERQSLQRGLWKIRKKRSVNYLKPSKFLLSNVLEGDKWLFMICIGQHWFLQWCVFSHHYFNFYLGVKQPLLIRS